MVQIFYLDQKGKKLTVSQWKLHNELHNLSSPLLRVIKSGVRWAGHAACMSQIRNVYKILVGKPEGKKSLGRPRHKWEDNGTDLKRNMVEGCGQGLSGSG